MKIKFLALAFAAALCLTACGEEDSDNPVAGPKMPVDDGKGPGNVEAGCNFQKTDNVWKYKYSSWEYIDIYTWVDETTVKYEAYAKAYHMEDSDTTYTNVNRDEFYEQVMGDCQRFQEMDQ